MIFSLDSAIGNIGKGIGVILIVYLLCACEDPNSPNSPQAQLRRAENIVKEDEMVMKRLIGYIDSMTVDERFNRANQRNRKASLNKQVMLRKEVERVMELRQEEASQQPSASSDIESDRLNVDSLDFPPGWGTTYTNRGENFSEMEIEGMYGRFPIYFAEGEYQFDNDRYLGLIHMIVDSFQYIPDEFKILAVGYANAEELSLIETKGMDLWDLSMLRATQVVRALDVAGIDARRLFAVGRGGISFPNNVSAQTANRVEIQIRWDGLLDDVN